MESTLETVVGEEVLMALAARTNQPINPRNIGEFNQALQNLNLPRTHHAHLKRLMQTEPRERLVRALNLATNGDEGAMTYLELHFNPDGDQQNYTNSAGSSLGSFSHQAHLSHQDQLNQPPAAPAPVDEHLAKTPNRHQVASKTRPLAAVPPKTRDIPREESPSHPDPSRAGGQNRVPHDTPPHPAEATGPLPQVGSDRPGQQSRQQDRGRENYHPNQDASSRSGENQKRWITKHVYGKSAALCFTEDETQVSNARPIPTPTVRLDAAMAVRDREYDWSEKISVQLTKTELPMVTAVFLGLIPSFEGKNHGPQKTKGFSVNHQGQNLYIEVFNKDQKKRAVRVGPEDAFYVSQILIRQLRAGAPWLNNHDIMTLLHAVIAKMKQSEQNTRQ